MTDRPILFSGAMIRALLDGRKSQTRRVLKVPDKYKFLGIYGPGLTAVFENAEDFYVDWKQRLPSIGDRLWCRETFVLENNIEYRGERLPVDGRPIKTVDYGPDWGEAELIPHYRATEPEPHIYDLDDGKGTRWSPSIFMPRWASRITLTVKDVRVQRVQEISVADCIAEGIDHDADEEELAMIQHMPSGEYGDDRHKETYADLWDSLNAKRGFGWDENPWIAAYSFTVHKGNIDMEKEG